MKKTIFILFCILFFNCKGYSQKDTPKTYDVSKSESEWKTQLTKTEFLVLRQAGTEPAFSSSYNKNYSDGIYICKGCQTPLFKSKYKFDSGSGWPSFDREIKGNVDFSTDYDLGYKRTEEHCGTCGSHLGHVFYDGPKDTTGKRHCVNGVSLVFVPYN